MRYLLSSALGDESFSVEVTEEQEQIDTSNLVSGISLSEATSEDLVNMNNTPQQELITITIVCGPEEDRQPLTW